ncbi:MAG: hypothetical protein FJY80_15470, partial [Candidatus Aminicenantes bacterium]|nr:hypothetical protein [Candidatus Aminicenantes bacterium]
MKKQAAFAAVVLVLAAASSCGRNALPGGSAKDVDMSPERLGQVSAVIEEAIGRKELPGAVLLVARRGKVVFHEA